MLGFSLEGPTDELHPLIKSCETGLGKKAASTVLLSRMHLISTVSIKPTLAIGEL